VRSVRRRARMVSRRARNDSPRQWIASVEPEARRLAPLSIHLLHDSREVRFDKRLS
jgi:hypothetical protein